MCCCQDVQCTWCILNVLLLLFVFSLSWCTFWGSSLCSWCILNALLFVFSPSGCTFWGKKPWSRKKKILWQLGTLVGAPVGISLVAGIAVPAMIIGIPVWVGRKVSEKYCKSCNVKEESFFSNLPNGFKMVKFKIVWCGRRVPAGTI